MRITATVNGECIEADDVCEGENLLFVLRERMGLPGSKNACEQGECARALSTSTACRSAHARCWPTIPHPVVMVALDGYESLKETAYLLKSPENAGRLLASSDSLEHGRTARDLAERSQCGTGAPGMITSGGRPSGGASPMTSRTQRRGHLTDGTGSHPCRESSILGMQRWATAD